MPNKKNRKHYESADFSNFSPFKKNINDKDKLPLTKKSSFFEEFALMKEKEIENSNSNFEITPNESNNGGQNSRNTNPNSIPIISPLENINATRNNLNSNITQINENFQNLDINQMNFPFLNVNNMTFHQQNYIKLCQQYHQAKAFANNPFLTNNPNPNNYNQIPRNNLEAYIMMNVLSNSPLNGINPENFTHSKDKVMEEEKSNNPNDIYLTLKVGNAESLTEKELKNMQSAMVNPETKEIFFLKQDMNSFSNKKTNNIIDEGSGTNSTKKVDTISPSNFFDFLNNINSTKD